MRRYEMYGGCVSVKQSDSDETAKALLIETIKGTVDELAKQDKFWFKKEDPANPGKHIIGWEIYVPV